MQATETDIFIIGAGINGAGIAADAAGRGLSVTLCEKGDLASATSSASSKLIHGGIRYLENYEFRLVRKSLLEREILFRNNPNIISALEFILPHQKHLRPAWLIRIGLFLYDHLASHPLLPNSKKINLAMDVRGDALLKNFKTGFSYYDCMTDDSRLVVLNAIAAKEKGATILTNTSFISAAYENKQWKIQIKNNLSNETQTVRSKTLINVSGPWVAEVQKNITPNAMSFKVELVKGSHIVVPKLYEGNFAYILQNVDKRIVFAIPYQNDFTLVGTTDIVYKDDASRVSISPEEEQYLCMTINSYFKKSITPANIVWSYAGVRCLRASNQQKPSDISRGYELHLQPESPLLTVIGGKLTSFRILADEAVEKLRRYFPHMPRSNTAHISLPGCDFAPDTFTVFYEKLMKTYPWIPEKILQRYATSYGTRTRIILNDAHTISHLGKDFGAGLYQKEVEYLIQHEWATSAGDILWRRTKLGLHFKPPSIADLAYWLKENISA
jgi:glycerol-3-phosphate dehydrogenase